MILAARDLHAPPTVVVSWNFFFRPTCRSGHGLSIGGYHAPLARRHGGASVSRAIGSGISDGYPANIKQRALVHSLLDWHHCHLRNGAMGYLLNAILAPARGLKLNPHIAVECEKVLNRALSTLDSFWLKDSGKFLLGRDQPSIADLSVICELMQFEVLDKEEKEKIFEPYKRIQQWIMNIKDATSPYFDEIHHHLLHVDRPRFREAVGRSVD